MDATNQRQFSTVLDKPRNDPDLARHYHRAEELIERHAPYLLPQTAGQEKAYQRKCWELAENLRDAEFDRFLEVSARWAQ